MSMGYKETMTDYDTIVAMLNKAGILFNTGEYSDEHFIEVQEVTASKTNRGYIGFHTQFYFDKDQNLIAMGAWE